MSNIKIVDVIENEAVKEEVNEEQPKEEVKEEVNEEQPKEEAKQEVKKRMKNSDRITCGKCNKTVSYKTYRYRHEKQCMNKEPLEERPVIPVKPQATPKPKALPKSKLTETKIENTVEKKETVKKSPPIKLTPPLGDERSKDLTQEVSNQVFKPEPQLSPYEVARQSYIQMKEEHKARKIEKINAFKSKMF